MANCLAQRLAGVGPGNCNQETCTGKSTMAHLAAFTPAVVVAMHEYSIASSHMPDSPVMSILHVCLLHPVVLQLVCN